MRRLDLATSLTSLSTWPLRRWATALLTAVGFALVVAIPTDLIDTPFFGREVPPTWWAWPSLILSSALAGLLVATYVQRPAERVAAEGPPVEASPADSAADTSADSAARGGWIGGVLTFFAVGCPVCNKLVLLALGSAGAMTWFEPVQPVLQAAAVALLLWALHRRLLGETSCPVPASVHTTAGGEHGR